MAVHFLEKSSSYKEQTDAKIYRRREVVASFMMDNYKIGNGSDEETYKLVAAKLADEGIPSTLTVYQADKVVLRTAYVWLTGGTEEKAQVKLKNSPGAVGVNCFMRDGIFSWEQLGYGATQPKASAHVSKPAEVASVSQVTATNKKLWDYDAGKPVMAKIASLVEALEGLVGQNEQLRQELSGRELGDRQLESRVADDQSYIQMVESELSQAEQRVREMRELVRSTQIAAHATTLELIAQEHPEFPQLTVIAQQIRENRDRQDKTVELMAKLPAIFVWANDTGGVEYGSQFLKVLRDLGGEEQTQTIRQLETLATHGPEYASLHTRKSMMRLPYSPAGCMVSRAADDLRFTWLKDGRVTIFWLYRKGDSRVRQSEA